MSVSEGRLYLHMLSFLMCVAVAASGCSNSGSIAGNVQGGKTRPPLSAASNSTQLNGTVTSVQSSSEFSFETGMPHGHVPVTYSSSMVSPSGSVIAVGEPLTATGSFDSIGKFSATAIVMGLPGTITAIISSTEFSYETGTLHGHVPVLYAAAVVKPAGATVSTEQQVNVMGTFNKQGQLVATEVDIGAVSPSPSPTPNSSPTPTATPSPTGTGPYHIATWAYDDSGGPGEYASASNVTKLVSYAQGNSKALSDCHSIPQGCQAVFYTDPNHEHNNNAGCINEPDASVVAASSENWYLHDTGYSDSSHRIYGKDTNGCLIWAMNPSASGLQSWWQAYLRKNADKYDLYFLDNDPMDLPDATYFDTSGGGCSPWPTICQSTQEFADNTALEAARVSFANILTHSDGSPMRFFYQQASSNIPLDVGALVGSNFVGFSCEGCIATYSAPTRPTMYKKVLDEMAAVNATPGTYLLISHGNSSAGSPTQILERLATIGIVWLAYSEGHTAVQPDLESNTNNLAVWPEDLIYPSAPLQAMVSGAQDLQVAPGVYRREFARCFQKGLAIGACATIVDANSSSVTISSAWLQQKYKHLVTLSGGDVDSGGVANISGAAFEPGTTSIQAGGAVLLTQ